MSDTPYALTGPQAARVQQAQQRVQQAQQRVQAAQQRLQALVEGIALGAGLDATSVEFRLSDMAFHPSSDTEDESNGVSD